MPDRRRHRGPHPEDGALFGDASVPTLRRASAELSWLLDRGYPTGASLKLVGDRHALKARQRLAVKRCACSADRASARRASRVDVTRLRGAAVWIDGFNVLTTVEAALGGAPLLIGRDGVMRDMASMHGSYRRVEETHDALHAIADVLEASGVRDCRWLLDAPVSNSGRLRGVILEVGRERGLAWRVDVVPDPDPLLSGCVDAVVATADSAVLDAAAKWWPVAGDAVGQLGRATWIVDLSHDGAT